MHVLFDEIPNKKRNAADIRQGQQRVRKESEGIETGLDCNVKRLKRSGCSRAKICELIYQLEKRCNKTRALWIETEMVLINLET